MQTNWRNFSSRIDVHEKRAKNAVYSSAIRQTILMPFRNLWRLIGLKRGTLSFGFWDAVTVEYRVLYSGTGLTRHHKIDN
jgi:hypothetical protein